MIHNRIRLVLLLLVASWCTLTTAQTPDEGPCEDAFTEYRDCLLGVPECSQCPVLGDGSGSALGEDPDCQELRDETCLRVACCPPCGDLSEEVYGCLFATVFPILGFGDCELVCNGDVIFDGGSRVGWIPAVVMCLLAALLQLA